MSKDRDYSAEYRRRIARGLAKGLTRSQARGHPKDNKASSTSKLPGPKADKKIDHAIRAMHEGSSLTGAARAARVSPERLRRYVKSYDIATRVGSTWVMTDNRPRDVPLIKRTSTRSIRVPNFAEASKVGRYFNAIQRLLDTGEVDQLSPFEGESVLDISGKRHGFETDPNNLFRWSAKDEQPFHEIYQIIAN